MGQSQSLTLMRTHYSKYKYFPFFSCGKDRKPDNSYYCLKNIVKYIQKSTGMGLTKRKDINVFKFLYKICLHKHAVCSQI